MIGYQLSLIRELRNQLLLSPKRFRREQADRVEQIAVEASPAQNYPYGYVHFAITRHPASGSRTVMLPGAQLRSDLLHLLVELSRDAPIRTSELREEVLTLSQLAARCGVSTRTVDRWRKDGLPARVFLFPNGLRLLGVSVERLAGFEALHVRRVERARRFSRIDTLEKMRLVRRAQRLTAKGLARTDIVRRLARSSGRSREAIRYTLQHAALGDPGVLPARRELPQAAVGSLGPRPPRTSITRLASRYGVNRSTVYRALYRARRNEILKRSISYVGAAELEKPGAEGKLTSEADAEAPPWGFAPLVDASSLDSYLETVGQIAVLSVEQERRLFERYNWLKYRLAALQKQIAAPRSSASLLAQFAALAQEREATRTRLALANLRLVVSVAKRHVGPLAPLAELIAQGNLTLLRAIEKFDYTRGNKFSTYATWALTREFARTVPAANYQLAGATVSDSFLAALATVGRTQPATLGRLLEFLPSFLDKLSPTERAVITWRFRLKGAETPTLRQLSDELGLPLDKIREVETAALGKLRRLADAEGLDLPSG